MKFNDKNETMRAFFAYMLLQVKCYVKNKQKENTVMILMKIFSTLFVITKQPGLPGSNVLKILLFLMKKIVSFLVMNSYCLFCWY
jgi:hypothetical protein